MNNIIDINEFTRAFKASELGDQIARGLFRQVGVIRTEYFHVNGVAEQVIKRQVDAVIYDSHLQRYYAVEQYRGLAIRAQVRDEEMLEAFNGILPELAPDEGFTYDQRIELSAEEVDRELVRAPKGVELNDGTEGVDA